MSHLYKSHYHLHLIEKKPQFSNQKLNDFLLLDIRKSRTNEISKTSSSVSTVGSKSKNQSQKNKKRNSTVRRKSVSFVNDDKFVQVIEFNERDVISKDLAKESEEENEEKNKKQKGEEVRCKCLIF